MTRLKLYMQQNVIKDDDDFLQRIDELSGYPTKGGLFSSEPLLVADIEKEMAEVAEEKEKLLVDLDDKEITTETRRDNYAGKVFIVLENQRDAEFVISES